MYHLTEAFVKLGPECNQRCLFCYTTEDKKVTTKEAKRTIDKYLGMGYEWISFTGGEPTIRNDLLELIEYAKDNGARIIKVQTNGLNISDINYLSELIEKGMNRCYISLLSHKPRIHNFLTQIPSSFKKTIKAVRNLIEFNIPIEIGCVITNRNYDHLKEFLKFMYSNFKEIETYQFLLFCPLSRGWKNRELVPRLRDLEESLLEMLEFSKKNDIHVFTRGIPLCYLDESQKASVETQSIISEGKKMIISDFENNESKHSFEESNSKAPQCKFCSLKNKCGGTWKKYLELFGYWELYPIYK